MIAAIRALARERRVDLAPDELAAMALAVEAEDLGIPAGPQDRVAQAHQGLVHMDFSDPGCTASAPPGISTTPPCRPC